MAPNGHARTDSLPLDHQAQVSSRPKWHVRHGSKEFKIWQKENPSEHISYDDWKSSQHGKGLSLYYAALHVWEESDSSEEEIEQPKTDSRSRTARAQPAREPKKTLKINGNGLSRSVGSATPSATAQSEDLSPSSKKKRKSRKKYLSQEIVASDETEDAADATTLIGEATTPSAPVITVNGRRKSSNRKPKKKPLSEETISPEDEEDDPMAINGLVTPAIASPLPVRSAPKPATAAQDPQPHKRTILKLSTRKAPKKKVLSEETVLDEDADIAHVTAAGAPPHVHLVAEPNNASTSASHNPPPANTTVNGDDATASPDLTSESAAATRRGLRARRPAQQRPYSLDAEIYEESEGDVIEEEPVYEAEPSLETRRLSIASLSKEPLGQLDDETLAILQGSVNREPQDERDTHGRSKHFKGKGRAWKKEESDEDHEFNPGKKKSAKGKAKGKTAAAAAQQPKKRGRPRKSNLSEDIVRDDSDQEASNKAGDASPSPAAPESATRKRKPSRKSVLSEELVVDDTEDEMDKAIDAIVSGHAALPEPSTPGHKNRGRLRKSDQSMSSKTSVAGNEEPEKTVSYTPKGTPNKSYTPKGTPDKSNTPKGSPKQTVSSAEDIGNAIEKKSPTLAESADIEAHMASVNAEDDDDEELCK